MAKLFAGRAITWPRQKRLEDEGCHVFNLAVWRPWSRLGQFPETIRFSGLPDCLMLFGNLGEMGQTSPARWYRRSIVNTCPRRVSAPLSHPDRQRGADRLGYRDCKGRVYGHSFDIGDMSVFSFGFGGLRSDWEVAMKSPFVSSKTLTRGTAGRHR
jgi:hypothetical protein